MARRSDAGFKVIVALTDKFTAPIKNINKSIQQSTAKVRGLMAIPGAIGKEAGFGKIGAALGNVGKQFGNLRSSVAGLIGPFLRIGGIIGGISLGKMVTDAVGAGAELVKLSKSTGVSVEGLQKLQYAATQSGLGADELGGALVKLNRSIAGARKGGKGNELVKVFDALKISAKELKTLNTEEIFLRIATAVSNMSDPIHQSETAMKLMGKSAAEMLALLAEGAPGIRALGKELESTGAIMDLQTALSAKEFGDIMTVVGHQIKGMAYTILKELLPSMKGSATGMKEWISANKDWIKVEVVATIQNIVAAGKAFVNIIRNDVIPVVKSMKPVWDAVVAVIGKGNAVLLAFTAVVAPGIIGSLFGIGKAFVALGATLLANPIALAIIGIVAAVAFLAYSVWKNWDEIKQAFTQGAADVGKTVDRLGEGFAELGRVATDEWFQVKWSDIEAELITGWGEIKKVWAVLVGNVAEAGREAWASLPDDIGQVIRDIGSAIGAVAGVLKDAIVGAFNSPIQTVEDLWGGLISFLQGAWDTITGIFGRKIETPQVEAGKLGGPWAGVAEAKAGIPAGADAPGGAWAGAEAINKSTAGLAEAINKGTANITEATKAPALGGAWAGAEAMSKTPLGGAWADAGKADKLGGAWAAADAMPSAAAGAQTSKTEIDVKFANAPPGMRASERSSGPADVSLQTQYAGPRGGLALAH
jgi:hypothetical protein